jgi:predicted lipoprotein with Yx(FWY)xxD motif
MLPRTTRSVGRWVAVLCAGAIALTAYGIGGEAAVAKTTKVTVKTGKVSGVGTVLVDSKGKTLYTLTAAGEAVPCTGACLAAWPPLKVKAGTKPKTAKGVSGVSADSSGQVTQDSLPLYRFAGDTKSGTAAGEGISSFGGTWHVVMASGSGGSTNPTPTTAAKSSSTGSYGY